MPPKFALQSYDLFIYPKYLHLGPYSLNLIYSKEPFKSKDFLYFMLLSLFLYSLNSPPPPPPPQTKEPKFFP